jgi:HTH-type transcriptional regulator / antitoxin PezA
VYELKNRIKQIRNSNPNWKSQDLFASFLGIPKANLSSYETGRRTPTDAVIQLICEKCSVNEEWLRNGTGEPFQPENKNDEISKLFGNVLKSSDDDFKYRLINALAKLDDSGWDNLEKLLDTIYEKK